MIDDKKRYVIKNYGRKKTFSNFLPSISGEMGIPLWCFYVNRGQAIASFGIQDKDHSIMQFYPAHQSYQNTKRMGFRTFVKSEGKVVEAFLNEEYEHSMVIGMNELEIEEENKTGEFRMNVLYYTLPSEELAGLIRRVTIENQSKKVKNFEIVDGMAAIIPYGINLSMMTEMGQTAKAWMQTLKHETGCPIFKVRASLEDSAKVTEIKGGNYGFAITPEGQKMPVIVSTETLFGYDTSLQKPVEFVNNDIDAILKKEQKLQNNVPCCFFTGTCTLNPGESYTFYEVFGQTENLEVLSELKNRAKNEVYFKEKRKENQELTWNLTKKIHTKTDHEIFDLYCRQTYLDNVLRGGEPIIIGKNMIFYLYSRKHGDIERDYNYFKILPEFFSQGNGNFRDVNQNRRCDVWFSPYVGSENIKFFYNAIQVDGYNPLGIEKATYLIEEEQVEKYPISSDFFKKPFTPGLLMKKLKEEGKEKLFSEIMEEAKAIGKTDFLEGYWSDHWTYNLDLVEEFLAIFPEQEEELLFQDKTYTCTVGREFVLPKAKRYEETKQGIRQYHFLEKNTEYKKNTLLMDTEGKIVYQTLLEKMFLLCLVKFAALDPYGMGIEMEGGKPGWYDALNGLPGLLGSSMAETYELGRLLGYVVNVLETYDEKINLPVELDTLLHGLINATNRYLLEKEGEEIHRARILFWKERGENLEAYRESVKYKLNGRKTEYSTKEILEYCNTLLKTVNKGIDKALKDSKKAGSGNCPTYFYYTVKEYQAIEEGYEIIDIVQETVPDFLEGSVRYLKRTTCNKEKSRVYQTIAKSSLYDTKLKMYKVNAGLDKASYEIGRAKAFTPGWLENESVWMHMEYKYLLELLKAGLYKEFLKDFYNAAIPFLNEETYGRSLLENSSFIASSANPDSNIHGKGFVARLSGSTVEFIHMWQIMMFGKNPFTYESGELKLQFDPCIPDFLIGKEKRIEATFLGNIKVIYHLPDRNTIFKGLSTIKKYELITKDGELIVNNKFLSHENALKVRNGMIAEIRVYVERIVEWEKEKTDEKN